MARCIYEKDTERLENVCSLGLTHNDNITFYQMCLFCNKRDVNINVGDTVIATDSIRKESLIGRTGTVRNIDKKLEDPYTVYFENFWEQGVGIEYRCFESSIEKITLDTASNN